MQLRVYNTLTRQKETLQPLVPGKVGMYVCGVTVYDDCHVGHARVCVVFDVVQRVIRKFGYDLKYVRNFTDVDDKIIARAIKNGETTQALTERYIASFYRDMDALDCQRPDVEPRVTTHMAEIIEMVQRIIGRGHAYTVPGEHDATAQDVYFWVASFADYGCLSGRAQEDNADGASERVNFDTRKRDQRDFALWKSAKPGEPSWDSPWGQGRPGWHIECSAMAEKHLGATFDLHGGGKDLIFPHHENEIAQARCASDGAFAKTWLHNGFVTIDAEKMAKSTGNFFTIRDVLARFEPQVLRYFLLTAHYLNPLNFSEKIMEEANRRVLAIYEKLALADALLARLAPEALTPKALGAVPDVLQAARTELMDALADDFNTPKALAALSEPMRLLGAALDKPKGQQAFIAHARAFVAEAGDLLGLFQHPPAETAERILTTARDQLFPPGSEKLAWVERLVQERLVARAEKDWTRADALRAELAQGGVELRDGREGTAWRPQMSEIE